VIVPAEDDTLRLELNLKFQLDVAEFETMFEAVRGVPGANFGSEEARTSAGAADLYTGDLLDGWGQIWCVQHREHLKAMYVALLDKLIAHHEAARNYEVALTFGERSLKHDNARERTHRQMMRLYYLAGDRSAALRQYGQCVAALRRELDVRPARRTDMLHELIKTDQLRTSKPIVIDDRREPLQPVHDFASIQHRLTRLRGALTEAERQITREIRAIESDLDRLRHAERRSYGRVTDALTDVLSDNESA
jgi:DNA-binding SARP family transcriptional activator